VPVNFSLCLCPHIIYSIYDTTLLQKPIHHTIPYLCSFFIRGGGGGEEKRRRRRRRPWIRRRRRRRWTPEQSGIDAIAENYF